MTEQFTVSGNEDPANKIDFKEECRQIEDTWYISTSMIPTFDDLIEESEWLAKHKELGLPIPTIEDFEASNED